MNRKFFINGMMIKRLMSILDITPQVLAIRLGKTQQAISQIQRRDIIKESDANKILKALGKSIEEVEKMDSEGIFSENYISENLIYLSENQQFQDFSAKMESMINTLSEQYSIDLNRLRDELAEKDSIILAKNKLIFAFAESMAKNIA